MPSLIHQADKRRQSGNAGRGEGRAVVGADRLRQAVFPKSPFEQRLGFVVPRAGGGRDADQIAAEPIGHRQRFDPRAVAEPNPTLVVDVPDMVGVLRRGQLAKPRRSPPPQAPGAYQPRPLQNFAGRRRRRPVRLRLARLELGDDLARPPGRTLAPQTHDRVRQMLRRRTAVRRRSPRPLRQARRPFRFITPEPLAAGIPADLVALTKLRHCPLVRSAIDNETHPLVHRTALSPGHRLVLPADRELSPIFPVRSVTYLSGPNTTTPSPARGEGTRPPALPASREPQETGGRGDLPMVGRALNHTF